MWGGTGVPTGAASGLGPISRHRRLRAHDGLARARLDRPALGRLLGDDPTDLPRQLAVPIVHEGVRGHELHERGGGGRHALRRGGHVHGHDAGLLEPLTGGFEEGAVVEDERSWLGAVVELAAVLELAGARVHHRVRSWRKDVVAPAVVIESVKGCSCASVPVISAV
jgi:hypothetical protein